jgi:hypothetical protein
VEIPFRFQLVNKQVDLLGDGILGRDFLEWMQARICYTHHTLAFTYAGTNIVKYLNSHPSCAVPSSGAVKTLVFHMILVYRTFVQLGFDLCSYAS